MITIKRTGEAELQRVLARLGNALSDRAAVDDLLVAVQPMVDAARANVPVGPPSIHLKENIGTAPDPDSLHPAVKVGAFSLPKLGEIFYGRFLELGTVKQSATPWLTPAFDSTREGVLARLVSMIRARIVAVGR